MFSPFPAFWPRAVGACTASRRTVCAFVTLATAATVTHAQTGGLSLDQALALASQRSASNQAASAAVQAMQQTSAKAGQLPDPTLKIGVDNLPVSGPDKYSIARDFMTMRRIGIEQQWVSAAKRRARSDRARRAVEMEESNSLANAAKVREETAKAWVGVFFAQKAVALYAEIVYELDADARASQAAHRGAKATASDVLQAQISLAQARDAAQKADQELRDARIVLARWIAEPVHSVADTMPLLVSHVADLPADALERYHPMVLTARRSIALADADTAVAATDRRPDWSVEAFFSQRGAPYSNMVSVGINIPLTTNPSQKQDRDIAEKSALGTRARLQYQEALRDLQTEIERLTSNVRSLGERAAFLNAELVPLARQQVDVATAAYRTGAGSLSAVFNARKMLRERQLQIVALEKEAALSWASLEYHVVPHAFSAPAGIAQ